ncbi:hypothetical protein [Massilia sp. YMA4]|uniref:hypothetical protein n=1 Tax=Massilia sp. YMA4 TaxID=1593482 RepID=UPI00187784B9|nr:hypothetical protein [Massilia sp. YMA4]
MTMLLASAAKMARRAIALRIAISPFGVINEIPRRLDDGTTGEDGSLTALTHSPLPVKER